MRIRAGFATVLMIFALGLFQNHRLCVRSLENSAHAFRRYFQALGGESLNPVERFVFSLALVNTKAQPETCKSTGPGA